MNKVKQLTFAVFVSGILATGTSVASENNTGSVKEYPAGIKTIIDKSCYGCHSTESKNDKGKEKLDFDQLSTLPATKQIAAYKHIAETLEEQEMPPQKFLERFPDKALSTEESEALKAWVEQEVQSILKN